MKKYILVPFDQSQNSTSAAPATVAVTPPDSTSTSSSGDDDDMSTDHVLSALPKNIKNRASNLLREISKSKYISWNDKGELIIGSSAPLAGSNIIDLIKYSQYPFKYYKPPGHKQFSEALHRLHIQTPITIQKGRGIPPGLPAHSKKTRNISQKTPKPTWRWKKM
jgi:hypothetical protein